MFECLRFADPAGGAFIPFVPHVRSVKLPLPRSLLPWLTGWLLLSVAAAGWLARAELQRLHEAFDADMRTAHRLLSLRAVEHEAILATLALLDVPQADGAAQRLPAIYPRVLQVLRREGDRPWSDAALGDALASAEVASRRAGRAWGLVSGFERGELWVVQASDLASHALRIDLATLLPVAEWPFDAAEPVRVELAHAGHSWIIQSGSTATGGWRFVFSKPLAVRSQPFDVTAERRVGWGELPWWRMVGAAALGGCILAGAAMLQHQRVARRRAEELLRLGQLGRLNAMGELAAGLAHELNQPLTAMLAGTRAAQRLLDDDPPELETARAAMASASAQARRAADVLARLRRMVERPGGGDTMVDVDLRAAALSALHLVEPRLRAHDVQARLEGESGVVVHGEPVALEQIIHNLIGNALQAMEQVPPDRRWLTLAVDAAAGHGRLRVTDSGPGIPAAQRDRVFQPFYTTRAQGLGLGLSLCESLAAGMDGRLELADAPASGASFMLSLPLAPRP